MLTLADEVRIEQEARNRRAWVERVVADRNSKRVAIASAPARIEKLERDMEQLREVQKSVLELAPDVLCNSAQTLAFSISQNMAARDVLQTVITAALGRTGRELAKAKEGLAKLQAAVAKLDVELRSLVDQAPEAERALLSRIVKIRSLVDQAPEAERARIVNE